VAESATRTRASGGNIVAAVVRADTYTLPHERDRAEGLVKIYRSRKSEVRALDGLDLTVAEGTCSDCSSQRRGQDTTVRILTTLLRPDSGHAEVAGLDVVRQAQQIRRLIGLSGQYAASTKT